MWLDKDNNEDPYNNGAKATDKSVSTPDQTSIGSGAGGGAPLGSGQGNQTNSTPSTLNPIAPTTPQKTATVQDYLSANKDQGNQLGQTFQSNLNSVGQKDTDAINTAADNVTKQAKDATVAYDPTTVNKAVSDPTSVANDPNSLQSFLSQWNAAYTGPTNFEGTDDYNKANSAATDAQTHATEVADAGGRKQILQDDYGVYGQGNKGLDQTLLQNSDNFGQVLDTGKQLASLPQYLTSKAADVDAATTKAATDTAATKSNTQALFQNALPQLQSSVAGEVTADQAAGTEKVAQIKSDLASGNYQKVVQDMAKAGVDPNSINDYLRTLNQTYGVTPNLSNYYTGNPATDVNAANAATSADYAKAAALQKLTGVDYSGVLNPADASKAGTWDNSKSSFNTKDLTSYIQGQVKQQDQEFLGRTNWADIASDGNTINVLDPKNFSNPDAYQDVYNKIVQAAGRSNYQQNPAMVKNLQQLYTQAAQAFTLQANHGDSQGMKGTDPNNPAIAGLRSFVNNLGKFLYGGGNQY